MIYFKSKWDRANKKFVNNTVRPLVARMTRLRSRTCIDGPVSSGVLPSHPDPAIILAIGELHLFNYAGEEILLPRPSYSTIRILSQRWPPNRLA